MKKHSFTVITLLLLASLILLGREPVSAPAEPDLEAAKTELNALADSYFKAWEERDLKMLDKLTASWGLYCGTDPKEFWTGEEIIGLWKEYFANTEATFAYSSQGRKINVSPCGMTGVIVNQGIYEEWSPHIPVRQTFHALKIGDSWQIVFINWAFVFLNEDVEKLNKALE